jgi:hypothetical protein
MAVGSACLAGGRRPPVRLPASARAAVVLRGCCANTHSARAPLLRPVVRGCCSRSERRPGHGLHPRRGCLTCPPPLFVPKARLRSFASFAKLIHPLHDARTTPPPTIARSFSPGCSLLAARSPFDMKRNQSIDGRSGGAWASAQGRGVHVWEWRVTRLRQTVSDVLVIAGAMGDRPREKCHLFRDVQLCSALFEDVHYQ